LIANSTAVVAYGLLGLRLSRTHTGQVEASYPTTDTYEVDRIVHRRELDRAARTLGVIRADDD